MKEKIEFMENLIILSNDAGLSDDDIADCLGWMSDQFRKQSFQKGQHSIGGIGVAGQLRQRVQSEN